MSDFEQVEEVMTIIGIENISVGQSIVDREICPHQVAIHLELILEIYPDHAIETVLDKTHIRDNGTIFTNKVQRAMRAE